MSKQTNQKRVKTKYKTLRPMWTGIFSDVMGYTLLTPILPDLADQYNECLFSATASDEQVWLICTFKNDEEMATFLTALKENPYIENCEVINLLTIVKGKKLFRFDEKLLDKDDEAEYFDDFLQDDEEDNETEKNTSAIIF